MPQPVMPDDVIEAIRASIGKEMEPKVNDEVEKGLIRRLYEAVGAPAPEGDDALVAPISILFTLRGAGVRYPTMYRNVAGGTEWEYFRPIRVGDQITATSKIAEVYQRESRSLGRMTFIIVETNHVNQRGEHVARTRSTGIYY
ncbi:MAG: MaoC family dehydratase N-terminal domain-containing protein [Chloroflexi bacterium]|nr:MaoC family dehydratase N-terminal domain-containing protein [Chloroflexota bacterium]